MKNSKQSGSTKSGKNSNNGEKRLSKYAKPAGMTIEQWQCTLRRQAAEREMLGVKPSDEESFPGEYRVFNPATRQEYKVVYRGKTSPWNYCSCMDFKTSQLGTCKHIEAVKLNLAASGKRPYNVAPSYSSIYLDYRHGREVSIRIGSEHRREFEELAEEYFDGQHHLKPNKYFQFEKLISRAAAISPSFRCYSDALDYVIEQRESERRQRIIKEKYNDASLDTILDATLYPYQKEGIIFATTAGRAIIADEMGLGKTIQAIGSAELLRREGFVEGILVVCPTSLKYQWKREIERFTHREVLVVEGIHTLRREQYRSPQPYKIASYNTLCNDIKVMGEMSVDMVIMDEVQRLKNWDTQIARQARNVNSRYKLLLSGTPLENKLEELYSIVELADQYALGPYYKFRDKHIVTNDTGKVEKYQNLNLISEKLKNVMIRRRKRDVQLQMPERTDQNLIVPMTKEQREIHDEFKNSVARLVFKWQRMHFLSETDRRRLMLLLSQMRMVCDSTFILDQKSRHDTKIDELMNIIDNVMQGGDEKVVVFSGWERMTRLVANELTAKGIRFEYLHGGIPSAKRKDLVNNFTDLPDCRVFLSTDAGSTGLNLQAASVIVNLDLPWNPAVLEQRIARIYRIGQRRNIQVINLVSAQSFEEEMIARLRFKSSLFEGALDGGEDTIFASDDKFKGIISMVTEYVENEERKTENGKRRTENGEWKTENGERKTENEEIIFEESESEVVNRSDEPSASSNLVQQGVSFLSGLVKTLSDPVATSELVDTLVYEDPDTGKATLNIPVPDKQTVNQFLSLLGRLIK